MSDLPNDRIGQFLSNMRSNAADSLEGYLRSAVPFAANPGEYDDGDAGDTDDDHEQGGGLAFEFSVESGTDNLKAAVAAWRAYGSDPANLVAHHPSSRRAFMGMEEDLIEFASELDIPLEEWVIQADPTQLATMAYDADVQSHLEYDLQHGEDSGQLEQAAKEFEEFHWGNPPSTVVLKDIPGIDPEASVAYLGLAKRLYYGSRKGRDGWVEYYHDFGEESGEFPSAYAVGDRTLVIHGGNFRITAAGLKD